MAKLPPLPVLLLVLAACDRGDSTTGLLPSLRPERTSLTLEACPNPRQDGRDPFSPGADASILPDQRTFELFNDGRVPGSVRATLGGEARELFKVMSVPDTLAPTSRGVVVVRFSPRARGSVNATLALDDEHEETAPVSVNLVGIGQDLPPEPVLEVAIEDAPGSGTFVPCQGSGCPAAFADTLQGQASSLRVRLRNGGCEPLRLARAVVRPDPAFPTPDLPFFLEVPAVPPTPEAPLVVPSGGWGEATLTLRFAPPRTGGGNGNALAELLLESNAPGAPTFTVQLFGQWLAPALSITPERCDLSAQGNACGATLAGGTSTGAFQVRNDGSASLTLTGASFVEGGVGGRFRLASSPAGQSLAPGAALWLQVAYQDAPLYVSDTLVLEAQAGGQPAGQTTLRVSGGLPPALATEPADRVRFADTQGVSTQRVLLRNGPGAGPLVLRRISLESASGSAFRLLGADALAGATLAAGEERSLDIEYTPPVTGGGASATLRIETNGPQEVRDLPVEG